MVVSSLLCLSNAYSVVILRLSILVMICGELVSVYAVRSTVFVLRRNVQLVHPEVCVRRQFLFRFRQLVGKKTVVMCINTSL